MNGIPGPIQRQLAAFDRAVKSASLAAQTFRLLGTALVLWAFLFFADYTLSLEPHARAALATLAGLVLALLFAKLVRDLLRRADPTRLALELERTSGLPFRNTLVTTVQLSDREILERYGYSHALATACAEEASRLVAALTPRALVDRSEARRQLRFLAAALAASALVMALGHDALGYIASRYTGAFGGAEPQGPVEFRISPGDARIAEGSDVQLRLELRGTDRFPRLHSTLPGTAPSLSHQGREGEFDLYTARLSGLTRSFDFWFEAGPFVSRRHRITVVRPPAIRSLAMRYDFPPYTGLKPETQEHGPSDIVVPAGTVVTMGGGATAPLSSVIVTFPPAGRSVARLTSSTSFTFVTTVRASGSYSIELVGQEGFSNRPSAHHVTAVEDRVPLVYVLEPGRDLSVAVADMTTFPVRAFATDDYGIRKLVLHYKIVQRFDYTFLTSDFQDELPLTEGDARKMTVVHAWELGKRVFQPGDLVTYYVEATDGLPGEPPHTGQSKTYNIRIPFLRDVYEETAEEQEEQIASVEELAARQKEVDEKLTRAMTEIRQNEGEVDWKTRQELETLSKKQQALKKRAEEVASEMSSSLEKLEKNELVDPGTLEKLQEVQELFQQVADGRMKEMMEKLRDVMQQVKLEPQALAQAQQAFDKQRYASELERVLESLKKLRVQQEMEHAVRQAEELGRRQEALRQETEERLRDGKPVGDLEEKQGELAEQTDRLLERMDELAEDSGKYFPEAAQKIADAAKQAREQGLQKAMEQAAGELGENQGEKALENQNRAVNALRELQDSLIQTQSGMKEKQVEVNLERLMALVRTGLDVSHVQEELLAARNDEEIVGDGREAGRRYAATQNRVHRGLESFERGFSELISDEVIFKSAFVSAVSEMIQTAREAVDAYEALHIHSGHMLAERNLEKLNRVIAKLIEMVQQLLNQQQSASMEGFFDQLEKLIQQQQRLNEQAERLKQQPSSNPLLQQMMARMAAEQAMIRQSMQELARKYQEAEQLVGDLQEIGREMGEVEEALRKFDLSDRTRAKQEKVLYRMLEAEKSIHKQGESRKRTAKIARDYSPAHVDPVERELTEVQKKLFNNLSRESYPVEHRGLVEDYLRSIAQ